MVRGESLAWAKTFEFQTREVTIIGKIAHLWWLVVRQWIGRARERGGDPLYSCRKSFVPIMRCALIMKILTRNIGWSILRKYLATSSSGFVSRLWVLLSSQNWTFQEMIKCPTSSLRNLTDTVVSRNKSHSRYPVVPRRKIAINQIIIKWNQLIKWNKHTFVNLIYGFGTTKKLDSNASFRKLAFTFRPPWIDLEMYGFLSSKTDSTDPLLILPTPLHMHSSTLLFLTHSTDGDG